jgi:hypothetical protein
MGSVARASEMGLPACELADAVDRRAADDAGVVLRGRWGSR